MKQSEENVTTEVNNKKKSILFFIICFIFIVTLWFSIYIFWSNHLDKKIEEQTITNQNIVEEMNKKRPIVAILQITYNDKTMSLDEFLETENIDAGTIFEVTVEREDTTQEKLNAYFVYSNDDLNEITYEENSGYLKITIPNKE